MLIQNAGKNRKMKQIDFPSRIVECVDDDIIVYWFDTNRTLSITLTSEGSAIVYLDIHDRPVLKEDFLEFPNAFLAFQKARELWYGVNQMVVE
jgi:hypothetical protein